MSNQLIKQLACLKLISETVTISASSSYYTLGIFKYSRPASPQNKKGILSVAVFSFNMIVFINRTFMWSGMASVLLNVLLKMLRNDFYH